MNFKRNKQIEYYTDLLKNGEYLLLKSQDPFFKSHYSNSPLEVLTGFKGTAGEAIIDKNGKITIFVDSRYHILVEKQAYKDIKIYKIPMGLTFDTAIKNFLKKGTTLLVPKDIDYSFYCNFEEYFNLIRYDVLDKFNKNKDLNYKNKIYLVDEKIEKTSFAQKIAKLKKSSPDIDKMLIFNLDNISHFTNLRCFQSKYSSSFKSILFLDFKNRNYILFLDEKLYKSAVKKIKIKELQIQSLEEYNKFIYNIDSEIYFDLDEITLNNFILIKNPKLIKKNSIDIFSSIKSNTVIEHLTKSSRKLDLAIYNFKNKLEEGKSEYELAKMFKKELIKQGAVCESFKTLLAINENSASIHYSDYDKKKLLKKESLLLLDCGGYYDGGYATDITRTFYFGQNPKPIYKEIYTTVLKAFINCYLSKETDASKLDKMARDILKPYYDKGFNFNHGLGHGIGTSVHQNPPRLAPKSSDIIKPYQTHSIEPGLYGKYDDVEFGVRIENCVYSDINYNKITLSKFPFEEVLINYNMLSTNEIEAIKNWQNSFKV